MKILQIVADGRPGGGTNNVLSLCEHLLKAGEKIILVTQKDTYAQSRGEELGIKVYGLMFFTFRFSLRISMSLARIIRDEKPDIIHAHGGRAGFHLSYIKKTSYIPTLYTVRGYHFQHKKPLIKKLAISAEKRISSRIDVTIFVAEADRKLSLEYGILPYLNRSEVIRNGIDTAIFPIPPFSKKEKCIGFLARMTYQKDPHFFLTIMERLIPDGYTGLMIGGGELEDVIREKTKTLGFENKIEITGTLPRKEALKKLAQVEILILPSRWEGLPLAPLEAMYMDIPVIAAGVNGTVEIMENERSGFLIKCRDPQAYVQAVKKMEDEIFKKQLIRTAKEKVLSEFTQDRVIKQHISLYNEVLRKQN